MTKVKQCGITNLEDAELCVEHGAWALGMIFVPSSPRKVKQADALQVASALRRRVELVGVFQNAQLDRIVHTVEDLHLSIVQLHGDEGPSYCAEVARRTGARVIKAVRAKHRSDVVALEAFTAVDFHMLDGSGGEPFEWALTKVRRSHLPLIVAGGLTAENVEDAIVATKPYAVDVASGTEREHGKKDPEKVAAFFAAVERAGVSA